MTLADFKEAVRYRVESAGKPVLVTHPTAAAGLEAHLNESLKQFTAWTFCLRGSVSTTLAQGASTLDVGALAPRVIHPLQLAVAGTILTNFAGRQGPCRIEEIRANAVGSGAPTRWGWQTNQVMQFDKAPGVGGSALVLYGFIEHPTVTTGTDTILLASEWREAAEDFAALRLVQPVATKANVEKVQLLNAGLIQDVARLCQGIQKDFPSLEIPMLREVAGGESDADQ